MTSYDQQAQTASEITVVGIATNVGINVASSLGVLMLFNFLRPKNNLVYAPKWKYMTDKKQPPKVGTGFFDWIKPVLHTKDSELMEKIGFDAIVFVRFIRICRYLMTIMCIIGVFILIPVNVLGTKYTSNSKNNNWPPSSNEGLLVISMSEIDGSGDGSNGNIWFWAHVGATWLFSLLLFLFLFNGYRQHVRLRQQYFASEEYQSQLYSRTLVVFNVPERMQSDERLGGWFQSLHPRHSILQALIGRKADKLQDLMEKHEKLVRELEGAIANYLGDGKKVREDKRPTYTVGGFFGFFGRKVDAIDYFTREIQELETAIERERAQMSKYDPTNYGFVSFQEVSWTHDVARQLRSGLPMQVKTKSADPPSIKLAPQPKDIIWKNVGMNPHIRKTRRLVGTALFVAFAFLWIIPLTALSAAAQIKNIIGIFPSSANFFKTHKALAGIIESFISPIIMAVFFLILPKLFRMLSMQQGTLTHSSLERQVLSKLYVFFIINNLLYFSISQFVVGVYGKIKQDLDDGSATPGSIWSDVNSYNTLNRLGQSLIDVSNYWINYVSLRGLTLILDLAQVASLLIIWLRKTFTNPTPRQIREFTRPPDFDYATYYNVHLFIFTVVLIYSVISPVILVFGLVYFLLTSLVFRYQLMYVYTTANETGGAMWRVVFNRFLVSVGLFQVVMIAALNLRGQSIQVYTLIPLPFITVLFKILIWRVYDPLCNYYEPKGGEVNYAHKNSGSKKERLSAKFGNPVLFAELSTPMVHASVKHLLGKAYHQPSARIQTKDVASTNPHAHTPKHMAVVDGGTAHGIKFQAIEEKELDFDDSNEGVNAAYKFDNQSLPIPSQTMSPPSRNISRTPSPGSPSQPLLSKTNNPEDMNYFVAGRSYAHHVTPRPELIEMAQVHAHNTSQYNEPTPRYNVPSSPPRAQSPPTGHFSPPSSQIASPVMHQQQPPLPPSEYSYRNYDQPAPSSVHSSPLQSPQRSPQPTHEIPRMEFTEPPPSEHDEESQSSVVPRQPGLGIPSGGIEDRYTFTGTGGRWDRVDYGGGHF